MTHWSEGTYYVVATERDRDVQKYPESGPDEGPIIFETQLKHATLAETVAFAERLGDKYGEARIAKVTFLDTERAKAASSIAAHVMDKCELTDAEVRLVQRLIRELNESPERNQAAKAVVESIIPDLTL